MDATQSDEEEAPFVPFTKAERIKQLGEIDESIVSLLRTVGAAIQSLGNRDPSGGGDVVMGTSAEESGEAAVFKHNMNEFLRTLRSVNVRMKRQIWGLEEAGIINLGTMGADDDDKSKTKTLQPDGNGRIGGMDTGWLNSRSNKVERDMEAELWEQAEAFLRDMLEKGNRAAGADSEMAQ